MRPILQGKKHCLKHCVKSRSRNVFSFSLTACLFSIFGLVVEREKFDKGDKVMYRSVKGKIAIYLGVFGKRRYRLSNNHDPPTVCCAVGGILWTQ